MDFEFYDMMTECEQKIALVNTTLVEVTCLLNSMKNLVVQDKTDVNRLLEMAKRHDISTSAIIKLNIGGSRFSTLKSTLTRRINSSENEYHEPHLFHLLLSGLVKVTLDENNEIFIDRSPKYFGYILDYFRSLDADKEFKLYNLDPDSLFELYEEVKFYNVKGLLELIQSSVSTCLHLEQFETLNELCRFSRAQKWRLLYRGSVDGFEPEVFHSKCDSKANTLTVIKSTSDCVFGGYVSGIDWDENSGYKASNGSFIFSLVNKANNPVRLNCTKNENSIFCHGNVGPTFGGPNPDIGIMMKSGNFSNLGSSYQLPAGLEPETEEAKCFLAGSHNFQIKDIEVFLRS
jgi:hypothetical protein